MVAFSRYSPPQLYIDLRENPSEIERSNPAENVHVYLFVSCHFSLPLLLPANALGQLNIYVLI
jgi:hypothetical protein